MKLFLKIGLLSLVSCSSLTTYTEEQLKQQSEKILEIQNNNKTARSNNRVFVKDIINNLSLKVISFDIFPIEDKFSNFEKANLLRLKFITDKEIEFKIDKNLKRYIIYIYFKIPQDYSPILKIARKYEGKWNNEVAKFFGDIEVDSVRIPSLEK